MPQPNVLIMGACLLSAPLSDLLTRELIRDAMSESRNGAGDAYYTIDEAIQALRYYRGELDVPKELRSWCSLSPERPGYQGAAPLFDRSDVTLLEINSPVAMIYRSIALGRAEVIERILNPLAARSEELHEIGNDWYYRGQMNANEAVIVETAKRLVPEIGDDFPEAALARSILLETRPRVRDLDGLVEGMKTLRDLAKSPLGIVTYTNHYLPDGRPLPWPPDFVDQTFEAARRANLPVFDPSRVVSGYGIAAAMLEDRTHYRDDFAPVLGEAMLPFIEGLADGSTPAEFRARPLIERTLERELAKFFRDEYARQGEDLYQWYRCNFVPQNIGIAHYDWRIADFVTEHCGDFRTFVEIGAGIGQQSMLLAVRGKRVVTFEMHEAIFEMARRAFERVQKKVFPELPKYMTQINGRFPDDAKGFIRQDTVLCFPTLSNTTTPEEDARIFDAIGEAGGVILGLDYFFIRRRTDAERQALVEQLRARGFEAPVPVSVTTEDRQGFPPNRIVFMRKQRAQGWRRFLGR